MAQRFYCSRPLCGRSSCSSQSRRETDGEGAPLSAQINPGKDPALKCPATEELFRSFKSKSAKADASLRIPEQLQPLHFRPIFQFFAYRSLELIQSKFDCLPFY